MAGPLDTGQQIATYLLLHIIPLLLHHLVYLVLPGDPMSFRLLEKTIAQSRHGDSGGILTMFVPRDSSVSRN
jgi:hypothetical protein